MLAVLPFISQRSRFRNCLWSRSDQYAMIGCYAIYIISKKTMTNVSSMVKGIFRSLSDIYKWAFYKNSFGILAKSSISDVAHSSEYLYDALSYNLLWLPRKWFVSKILFVAVSTEGKEGKELKLDRWNIWIITAINLLFFVSILLYIPDSLRFSLTYSVCLRTLNVDISIFQSPFLQVFLFTYFLLMQFLVTLRMKQVTNPFL